jgi:hypothetical protein
MTLPEEKEAYAIRESIPSIQHRNHVPHPAHTAFQPSHTRTQSRDRSATAPAPLNTSLASSAYVSKYVPALSPPNEINSQGVMVDPYPSPPKSLDSPPPELNDLMPKGTSSGNDTALGQKLVSRNRRSTIQGQHAAKDISRQLESISVR